MIGATALADVAKATLYSTFGSKDELVRAYLQGRHARRSARMMEHLAQYDDPQERLLGVFDHLAGSIADPTFHGCAFVNASAESAPGSAAEQASDASSMISRPVTRTRRRPKWSANAPASSSNEATVTR